MFCIFDVKSLKQCSIYTIFLEKEVKDKISVNTNIYTTILTSQCQDGQTINNLIRKGISSFHLWIMHVWQGASMSCYSWSRSASSKQSRTTDTQWRHRSKISEKMGQWGRQNMLRPYLKIWDWIFGRAAKAISSLGVRSPWIWALWLFFNSFLQTLIKYTIE